MPKIILVDELSDSIDYYRHIIRKINEVIHIYNVWQYEDNFDLNKGRYVLARVELLEKISAVYNNYGHTRIDEMKDRLIELGVRNDD